MNEEERTPDFYDRLIGTRLFSPLQPFLSKHRDKILYLFFGVLTTAVGWISFDVLLTLCHLPVLLSNGVSWVLAVSFAFFTNRRFVFASHDEAVLAEGARFVGGRLFTLGFEEAVLYIFCTLLSLSPRLIKALLMVTTTVGNYLVSKLFVFKK